MILATACSLLFHKLTVHFIHYKDKEIGQFKTCGVVDLRSSDVVPPLLLNILPFLFRSHLLFKCSLPIHARSSIFFEWHTFVLVQIELYLWKWRTFVDSAFLPISTTERWRYYFYVVLITYWPLGFSFQAIKTMSLISLKSFIIN